MTQEEPSLYSLSRSALEDRTPLDPALLAEFERLVAKQRTRIRAVCMRVTGDREVAEELTQDTLLTAYRKLASWDQRSSLSTWVCGIAKYKSFNHVRRRSELLTEDGVLDPDSEEQSALKSLSRAEREHVITEAAAACLTPVQQEVVHLRYVEGLAYDQINDVLEIESKSGARGMLQTSKNRLAREVRARLEALGHGTSFLRTRV